MAHVGKTACPGLVAVRQTKKVLVGVCGASLCALHNSIAKRRVRGLFADERVRAPATTIPPEGLGTDRHVPHSTT